MKNIKFCPKCFVKRAIRFFKFNNAVSESYNNSAALTPPMGWSSWNLFRNKINEELIKEIACAISRSGLSDCGYKYINIDDCWQSSRRDENGRLQSDLASFPSGIKELCKYVNNLDLKLGIYSSNGTLTCEDYPASLYCEKIDADTFAAWGVEYFKYDFCHNEPLPTKAPLIINAEVKNKNFEEVIQVNASQMLLKGGARLIKNKNTEYIKGLCSKIGTAELIADAVGGDYIFTLTVKKIGRKRKFAVLRVNGKDEYPIYAPGTRAFSKEGRLQLEIKLKAGKNLIEIYNPVASRTDSAFVQYRTMGRELKRATREYAEKNGTREKPIVYSICEWGLHRPWKWGGEAGNLWRTTHDIMPIWLSVVAIYNKNLRLGKYARPGAWNDPDMLEVGNGRLTYEENRSHFALWCMMCAPLILGNDIRKFIKSDGKTDKDNKIYQILTNKHLIAINQDILGIPCKKEKSLSKFRTDVLVKPLDGRRAAVCVFNKGIKTKKIKISLDKIADLGYVNLKNQDKYKTLDCHSGEEALTHKLTLSVKKHAAEVYIIE